MFRNETINSEKIIPEYVAESRKIETLPSQVEEPSDTNLLTESCQFGCSTFPARLLGKDINGKEIKTAFKKIDFRSTVGYIAT